MKNINIVYFIWVNPKKDYNSIILGQLTDMIDSGILEQSSLYIEVSCENEDLKDDIHKMISDKLIGNEYYIQFYNENKFEYYGIKKLYDLAIDQPSKYYLYLHSKCMFNYNNEGRHIYEKTLTKGSLVQYKKVIKLFKKNKHIDKIGLFPSSLHEQNFIWLNFFWAKGSYINTCEDPVITDDRYYYERWSGSGERESLTYNLFEDNYKKYALNEVGDILNLLNGEWHF